MSTWNSNLAVRTVCPRPDIWVQAVLTPVNVTSQSDLYYRLFCNCLAVKILVLGVCLLLVVSASSHLHLHHNRPQPTTSREIEYLLPQPQTTSGLMQQNQRHATLIALDPWNRSVQCVETTDDSRGNSIESVVLLLFVKKWGSSALPTQLFVWHRPPMVRVVVIVMLCLMVSSSFDTNCLNSIFTLNTQPLFQ